MSTGYYGEKIDHRQRICLKCHSFVTHDKVEDGQFACPLCGYRAKTPPNRVKKISVRELAIMVAAQVKAKSQV